MPNPTWPADLPTNPYAVDGANYAPPGTDVIRTAMEVGPPKMRRRSTSTEEPLSFTLHLSKAQLASLQAFYLTTLKAVLPFDWIDFRTGTAATYRFISRSKATYLGGDGDYWAVEIRLEKLP